MLLELVHGEGDVGLDVSSLQALHRKRHVFAGLDFFFLGSRNKQKNWLLFPQGAN